MRNLLLALLASSLFVTTPLYELETELETEMESDMDFEELYYELLEKYEDLLEKYEALAGADQEETEPTRLISGMYVVGEDIPAGTYAFDVEEGAGVATLFKSYDACINSDYTEVITMFTLASKDVLKDQGDIYTGYVSEVSFKVKDGICISLTGVTLQEKVD